MTNHQPSESQPLSLPSWEALLLWCSGCFVGLAVGFLISLAASTVETVRPPTPPTLNDAETPEPGLSHPVYRIEEDDSVKEIHTSWDAYSYRQ